MKVYDTEGGWLRIKKVVLINVCGIGAESWRRAEEAPWLIPREEFAVDTFVLCK